MFVFFEFLDSGGRCPTALPLLAGRWPAERLERFAISVVIMDDGVGVYKNDDYSD